MSEKREQIRSTKESDSEGGKLNRGNWRNERDGGGSMF